MNLPAQSNFLNKPNATYVYEGLLAVYRIGKYYSSCSFVIGLSYGLESLLSSCVPDLQFKPIVLELNDFGGKIDSNGRNMIVFEANFSLFGTEPRDDICFSYSWIPNYYYLYHIIIDIPFLGSPYALL